MYERFTDRARKVMQLANQEAQRYCHEQIDTEHVLLGLMKEGQGVGAQILTSLGVDLRRIRLEIEKRVQSGAEVITMGKLPQTREAKKVVEYTMEEAHQLNHGHYGTEHFLLGLLRVSEGKAAQVLGHLGVSLEFARDEIMKLYAAYPKIGSDRFAYPSRVGSTVRTEARVGSRNTVRTADPLRILDASANRATEGLRVVEDYARFVLDDAHLTTKLKQLRHDLAQACNTLLGNDRYPARDTQQDVGTTITTRSESKRIDAHGVCIASLERTKQSLRSLEEYSKVPLPCREGLGEGSSDQAATKFESLRYQLYTLEKALTITVDSTARLGGVTLCTLIDGQASEEDFTALVEKLLDAGVGMIQLRDKQLDDRQLIERAKLLKSLTTRDAQLTTLTIINDRADIAAAASADGVHLGQEDLSVKDARAILGPRKLIGVSTHSLEQARQAVLGGANYLGAGPTFPSTTKSFEEFPGLDYLREVAEEISLPTFAIGGINVDNLPQVLETGITRIAVSSAASQASELLDILENEPPRTP